MRIGHKCNQINNNIKKNYIHQISHRFNNKICFINTLYILKIENLGKDILFIVLPRVIYITEHFLYI